MQGICKFFPIMILVSYVLMLKAEAEPGHPYGVQNYGHAAGAGNPSAGQEAYGGYPPGYIRKCYDELTPTNRLGHPQRLCHSRSGYCAKAYFTSNHGTVVRRYCLEAAGAYAHQACQYKQIDFLEHGFQQGYLCVCNDRDFCNGGMFRKGNIWITGIALAGAALMMFRSF